MSKNPFVGIRNHASSPSSIANMEHHDPSGSQKNLDGSAATVKAIHSDAVEHTIEDFAVLRVANTTNAVAYLWVGEAGSSPGAPAITNAIAIMPETSEMIFCGAFDDSQKSVAFKASIAGLQVIEMYS